MTNGIDSLDDIIFDGLLEDVYFQRPGYSQETITATWERLYKVGKVVGSTMVFRAVHDGEVGVTVLATPIDEDLNIVEQDFSGKNDPIAQGI
ncbi:hypothetical protein KDA11_05525 [Candidatus Saccharibacteria bacterium]|nr:hypothetical protein [Candidatus Saccharibacteria bacterium]